MLIFHHIPKTAGTSFVDLLRQNYSEAELLCPYDESAGGAEREWYEVLLREHPRLRCVAAHSAHHLIPLLTARGAPCEVVSFLRDPVQRCVSLYFFVRELGARGEPNQGGLAGRFLLERNWSLADIYQHADALSASPERRMVAAFFDGQARAILAPYRHRLPFTQAPIAAADAERLEQAIAEYDFGVCEQYDESVLRWARRFGWRTLPSERKNVGESRQRADPVSEEVADLIRSYNRVDVDLHARASARAGFRPAP